MLEGKNITLRSLKMSDWEKSLQWRNNLTIKQMAMMHPFPITEMVEKEWYENIIKSKSDKTIYFTITTKDDQPIGFVTLNKINQTHNNCYLGIVIGEPDLRGQGYGKETMGIIITYAFKTLNLNKITIEVIENNRNAITLYNKLGFIQEGKLKKQFYTDGKYLDVIIMSAFKVD